jgi:hypothetical protein
MIDVNLKGVLYGIAAALPVFRRPLWDFTNLFNFDHSNSKMPQQTKKKG